MNATGPDVPPDAAPDRATHDRRGSPAARAAGLAFLPLPLVPFVVGLASVINDPNRPGSGCFEYCEFGRNLGRLTFGLGVVGIWLALLIWRRHLAAIALALFVTALLTAIWSISLVVPLPAGQSALLLNPLLLALGVVVIAQDALLVAALRVEMNRAGETAVASLSGIDSGGPAPPA
jgi:hypothetical protein